MSSSNKNPVTILQNTDLAPGSALSLKQQQDLSYSAAKRRQDLQYKAADKGIDAVADLLGFAMKAGNVALESKQLDDQLRSHREQVDNEIRKLDAESRRKVEELSAELSKMKEGTDRLQLLLTYLATQGENLNPALAAGIGKALDNVTQN